MKWYEIKVDSPKGKMKNDTFLRGLTKKEWGVYGLSLLSLQK